MTDPFIDQLAELCRLHPTRAKWVLVGSNSVGHTLGERLALEGTNWANLRFKTPFDLALETAAPFLVERGIDPLGDEIGAALMMRLLADLPAGTRPYFRTLGSHHEMGAALWSSIRELRLAGISAAALSRDAFESEVKHAELQALLAAYESWLASTQRADQAGVYAEARLHAGAGPVGADDVRIEFPDTIWPPLVRQFLDALPGERLASAVPHIPGLVLPRRLQDAARDERVASAPLTFLVDPGTSGTLVLLGHCGRRGGQQGRRLAGEPAHRAVPCRRQGSRD